MSGLSAETLKKVIENETATLRAQLAAKDAEIAALREVVKQARVYVRSDQEWLREELDAALEMSGGVK